MYQSLINRQGRAITGMFRSAPPRTLTHEAGLPLALSLLNNRQRRYRFRVLMSPVMYPTNNILPTTPREGDEQPQKGVQSRVDGAWAQSESRKPRTLR